MNKPLLLGSALLVAISAFPQNGKLRPSGFAEVKAKNLNVIESTVLNSSTVSGPVKQINHKSGDASKISVVTASRFTGSGNVFSYLVSQSKPLCYNPGVNAITFIHRKSPFYVVSANGNSGSIVSMISTNVGNTWDSTCVWAHGTNLGRYPQGGIYNPLGNTNKNNAYVAVMGPITGGSGWLGNYYASKTLNGAGNNTPGADQQAFLNATPTIKKHEFSRYSFTAIDGGLIRSLGTIWNDANNTTSAAAQGLRGAVMAKGQFNAGAFVWTIDSFVPATTKHSAGQKNIDGTPLQAWSENGTIGYVVIVGSRATETISATRINTKGGYQPIVYKTTNSGATWSMLPANDFSTSKYRGLQDRMYPIETNTAIMIPNFGINEGNDVTVDINGNLHFVTNLIGHSSSHVDSLRYRYTFGTEQYNYRSANFDWPIIYDFYTNSTGGWDYHMVDSMYSEGPGEVTGDPGVGSNPWTNAADKVGYDARIQVSRTVDGKKILYSWAESDTSLLGTKWNAYPDIMMRGFDVTINKVTPTYNVTGGVGPVDAISYFHYMSNKAVGSSSACVDVPFTAVTSTSGSDGLSPVNVFYIKGAQMCAAAFNMNPMAPTGVAETTNNNINFDVLNFPNPASAATTILVNLKDAKPFEIAIYNAVGQLVDTYKVNGQFGANEINIDLSNFASGVYVYNVKVGNSTVTKKLIVQ